jgi:hypothetical protein
MEALDTLLELLETIRANLTLNAIAAIERPLAIEGDSKSSE